MIKKKIAGVLKARSNQLYIVNFGMKMKET